MALILIADDEPFQRYFLRATFSDRSEYNIIEAQDGLETLQAIQVQQPDLVILDLKMPVLDGLEICRRIKADPALRQTIVVLVTASSDVTAGRLAGCDEYVIKPYNPDELEAIVHRLLHTNHTTPPSDPTATRPS